MEELRFSTRYYKIQEYVDTGTVVKLIFKFPITSDNINKEFKDYDCSFYKNGVDKLYYIPIGIYFFLLFKKEGTNDIVFTTLRKFSEENNKKFRVGKKYRVVIE
jgi:hypothetical protein